MSAVIDEALRSVKRDDLVIHGGDHRHARLLRSITGTNITRTIAGSPTLELSVNDSDRTLLDSGILTRRAMVHCGPFTYELQQVSKSGTSLTLTLEDQAVAALRENRDFLVVRKGLSNHVAFARRLVNEVRWLKFVTDPSAKVVPNKADLTRGDPKNHQKESSWDAITRMAQERGWRAFVRGVDEVWYVPDQFLFAGRPNFLLREGQDGVDTIDFDFDAGKRVAQATVTARTDIWKIPPGSTGRTLGLGPGNSKWIIQDISRPLEASTTSITLTRPQPVLPEPKDTSAAGGGNSANGSSSSNLSGNPAVRVAQFAIDAGFSGDKLVRAVAVSFAEDTSHKEDAKSPLNSDGSYDRGLWQINSKAHRNYSDAFCYDGAKCATAAYRISSSGNNWTPWTTFRNGDYLQHISAAKAAIAKAKQLDAESSGHGKAPKITHSKLAVDFVNEALSQRGKAYVYGSPVYPHRADPKSFDCSALVEWAAARVGVSLPRTSGEQYAACAHAGRIVSVDHAAHVRGALLFEGSQGSQHVVISLGNGSHTIEAMGRAYGVLEGGIRGRGWSGAGLVPGMRY